MGFLTTVLIRNNALHEIVTHPTEFCDGIEQAIQAGEARTVSLGDYCNPVEVKATRHADAPSIYVHMGNTLSEMSQYSKETQRLMRERPDFFKEMLEYLEYEVRELKKAYKESKRSAPQSDP